MKNEAYVSPKGTTQTGNNVMNLDSWISFDGFRGCQKNIRGFLRFWGVMYNLTKMDDLGILWCTPFSGHQHIIIF